MPLLRFVCVRRPLQPSHVPTQSPAGMAPDYLSLWRWIGSNAIGRNREGRGLTKCSQEWSAAMARVIVTILLPFGSSLRVSIYRRRVESAPRVTSDLPLPGMQLSFFFDCDDVALPALKLDLDTELARVVPADVEVRQKAGLHDVERGCDNRF